MITRKPIRPADWCSSCRFAFWKAFLSSSGLPLRPSIRSAIRRTDAQFGTRSSESWKSYATTQPLRSDSIQQTQGKRQQRHSLSDSPEQELLAAQDLNWKGVLADSLAQEEQEAQADQEGPSSLPWYLQVETPRHSSNPLLERQKLPPLPPNAPPLLQPVLEHLSKDVGLDDMRVLDLRDVDPPPALGANLLMIIGTARSEKHLHVSADRFCRWLKATHKLSPYADGLLGRGELKLKLRRKARRAKMMRNVGSSEVAVLDDGLRTGWICVNVGNIPGDKTTLEDPLDDEEYVGFGSEVGDAKVVIQMLTQDKREELDLEDLWEKTLRRHERKESTVLESQRNVASVQEVGQNTPPDKQIGSDFAFLSPPRSLQQSAPQMHQIKLFHQCSLFSTVARGRMSEAASEDQDSSNVTPVLERAQAKVELTYSKRLTILRSQLKTLRKMSSGDATYALGKDTSDQNSTSFLKSFYDILPQDSRSTWWHCRLDLICQGVRRGHPGYTKKYLVEFFNQKQSLGDGLETDFLMVFSTLLAPNPVKARQLGFPTLTPASLFNAYLILDAMYTRGYNIEGDLRRKQLLAAAKLVFQRHGTVRTKDVVRLRQLLDRLHFHLHDSPSYAICLRLLLDSCDALSLSRPKRHQGHEERAVRV